MRGDFPALEGENLVYLDSAASALKPRAVVSAVSEYYSRGGANVHRGVHRLSSAATDLYESSRKLFKEHLNARGESEIIFTRGTTEGINLVADSWGRSNLEAGDVILLTRMEHHSNIVPWQLIAERTGARIEVLEVDDNGDLILPEKIDQRVKMIAVCHVSNTLGTVNPVQKVIALARSVGARVLLDAAQSAPHLPLDVGKLDCDFLVFSGHKMYGPTGVGVLYGKEELLERMPPWQGGGAMIKEVTFPETTYNDLPEKFEAGTPPVAQVIGLGAALRYLQGLGFAKIHAREKELADKASRALKSVPGLRVLGNPREKLGVFSFVLENAHSHDVGMILDQQGVAVRTGHHCTGPLLARFGLSSTVRASLALYNNEEDIEKFIAALEKARELLL